jgi:hypothetical protein
MNALRFRLYDRVKPKVFLPFSAKVLSFPISHDFQNGAYPLTGPNPIHIHGVSHHFCCPGAFSGRPHTCLNQILLIFLPAFSTYSLKHLNQLNDYFVKPRFLFYGRACHPWLTEWMTTFSTVHAINGMIIFYAHLFQFIIKLK